MHAFLHRLLNLWWHFRNHIYNFFLSLLCFIVSLDNIKKIKILFLDRINLIMVLLNMLLLNHIFHIKLLSLHNWWLSILGSWINQFLSKNLSFMKYLVPSKWINWILLLINIFMFIHLLSDSLTQRTPFLLIFIVSIFHSLNILLHYFTLISNYTKLFSQFLAFYFFFLYILI